MALIWTINVNYQPTRTAHFVRIHIYYIYIFYEFLVPILRKGQIIVGVVFSGPRFVKQRSLLNDDFRAISGVNDAIFVSFHKTSNWRNLPHRNGIDYASSENDPA